MNTLIKRLLIFFLGVPLVVSLILFLPFHGHLALNIAVVLFTALGAVEFSVMLEKKQIFVKKAEAFIIGALSPLSALLTVNFNFPLILVPLLIMPAVFYALLSGIFVKTEKMEFITGRLTGIFSVLVYPGFFMYWLVQMTAWSAPGFIILFFVLIVFGSDSSAWLFGMLFGEGNRGFIPASPNKSIAGYAGGVFGSIVISVSAAFLIGGSFTLRSGMESFPLLLAVILLGFFTGIAAALGDLAESAIKRSCGVKDSGSLILGRGGILDSIDSIALAAPVFFLLYNLFFTGP